MEAERDELIQTDLIEPQSVAPSPATEPAAVAPKPRRSHKRKASSGPQSVDMASIAAESDVMPDSVSGGRSRSRRAKKITGDDVAGMIELGSGLVVMLTRRQHWLIPATEVKPWAGDAAEILNRIPAKYVTAAASASGYFAVAAGIYATVKPRLDIDAEIAAAQKRAAAQERARMNGTAADTSADAMAAGAQLGADVPWGDVAT